MSLLFNLRKSFGFKKILSLIRYINILFECQFLSMRIPCINGTGEVSISNELSVHLPRIGITKVVISCVCHNGASLDNFHELC